MDNISKSKKKLTLSLLVKIIMDMVRGFMDDSVLRLSASLAYATLFSIIPFLSLLIRSVYPHGFNPSTICAVGADPGKRGSRDASWHY